jgi:hypothetical protein
MLSQSMPSSALPVSDASAAYSDLLTMMMQILPIQQQ